jgi:hypothetical protein
MKALPASRSVPRAQGPPELCQPIHRTFAGVQQGVPGLAGADPAAGLSWRWHDDCQCRRALDLSSQMWQGAAWLCQAAAAALHPADQP